MTQRDKWKPSAQAKRYFAYKDECRLKRVFVPTHGAHITFHLPMPKSWSQKKRKKMDGRPHKQRPDKDNLEKALLDAVYSEDCAVWDSRVTKLWAQTGKIEIIY
ncbi:RusA family crossover junction endodeoxyribonuclease [Vibrio parahaemolyticus]|nr:RusA family crossover junction endodeoxyribonuclease [Vibrio parahaemolyticus]